MRVTVMVVILALLGSLTQALVAPLVRAAVPGEVPRDLPMMAPLIPLDTLASAVASGRESGPEQPTADFTPLTDGPAVGAPAAAAAPETSLVAPVDEAVVATETPRLEVAAVGGGVLYCFKVSTGVDGRSGSVVDAGCLPTPQWTVPQHVLHDGGRYSWTVGTAPAGGGPGSVTPPRWVGHFTVNQRVGDPGPAPTDVLGPTKVNLFNGNLHTEFAGPRFEAVGGSAGVTFAYNSRQNEPGGVRASYFNDSRHAGTPDDVPVMVRSEPQVNLDWGNMWSNVPENFPWREDPMPPALAKDWFVVRWEGHFRAPATGDFRFAGAHADGARIWVGDKLVYDNPDPAAIGADFLQAGPRRDTEVPLTAGQRVPIRIELYHHSGERPRMVLWAKSTTGPDGRRSHSLPPRIVPTDWLYAQDPPPLPGGWTLGVAGSGYSRAEMLDGSVVLTDAAGGKHTWARASSGGYRPPPGEDGVVALDAGGRLSVTDKDTVSLFNVDGTLAAVSSVLDSRKPAALQYLYSGSPARLTRIKDPVSGRAHLLYYNTDNSDSCYGGVSRPKGADAAPAQKLCRIRYWDGTETRLWYVLDSLGRIENPGADIRDMNYQGEYTARYAFDNARNDEERQKAKDSLGPLVEFRNGMSYDWVARRSSPVYYGNDRTLIEYGAFYDEPPLGHPELRQRLRAVTVTGPSPDGVDLRTRPIHRYRYDVENRRAYLGVAGVEDYLRSRTVTYDDAGRVLTSTDIDGVTAAVEWNAKDKPVASVDARGRRIVNAYDHADRLTDSYGAAPASCFDGPAPTAACAGTVPHTHLGYDEGMAGLQAVLYDNPFLAGLPAVWQTGVGTVDGSLSGTWDASPPVPSAGGWSGRFTGEMRFPDAGDYGVGFTATDGVRLWIDDFLVVDSWTDKASSAVAGVYRNAVAGSWHRVRIDHYDRGGRTGELNLTWTPPGTGAAVTVPGAELAPRYGYETSKATDSTSGGTVERAPPTTVATGYADPANGIDPVFGLVVSKTSDPGGLALVRRNSFERPGEGFLRRLAEALPGGDITDPDRRGSFTYYGGDELRANPCDPGSAAVSQGGMAKSVRAAGNADGSANVAEQVYNGAGDVVAHRINNEPWSCVGYDTRGRVVTRAFPAMGGQPARTVTYDYAPGGDPLTKRISDASGSTTTVVDLLGRVVSYTDTTGVVTTSRYDVAGRRTGETTTVKGVASTLTYRWSNASRLTGLDLDGTTVATSTYDAGFLRGVNYGNGSTLAITYNDAEVPTTLTWRTPASTVTETVTRSRDRRITDGTVTDSATGAVHHSSYTYDGVGRLVAATVPHHRLTYSYAGDGGCGPNRKAGANTNRTAFTDSLDGAPAVTTTYCYDDADRLLSTSGATALAFAYDVYGNATQVGTDTLGYDSTRRHVSTTTAAGRSVRYTRDVTDRITARSVQDNAGPAQVTRYGFTSGDDGPAFVLDGSGKLLQRVLKLAGGVVLTKTYTPSPKTNWSYPSVHGDILFTADGTAARTGTIHLYDPFGQNIDPVTGAFADIPIPATAEGGMDFGWLGSRTVPVEHVASQQALEMGDRTYLPVLGRFLQTDPVSGGSANTYEYVNGDPVNSLDLTGRFPAAIAPLAPLLPELGAIGPAGWAVIGAGVVIGAGIYAIEKANEDKPAPAKAEPEKPAPANSNGKTAASDWRLGDAEHIAEHAYQKHVVDQKEFPEISSEKALADLATKVMKGASEADGTQVGLKNGRTGYTDGQTIVVHDPTAVDMGTVFRPTPQDYAAEWAKVKNS
ncbi:PA14 domain-containing protein [Kitasatospora purpeofusca]|uniref:PA14 domain-containing protein n=1 Tax=Kitasatospora purpeofusca TaxID=67352 RepID=UPI00324D5601